MIISAAIAAAVAAAAFTGTAPRPVLGWEGCAAGPTSVMTTAWWLFGSSSTGATTTATSIWAGLGHHGRERGGFTATGRYGHTTYKVWTQVWPNPPVAVPEVAHQGDYVSVHIRYLGGTRYAIGITDRNQGWHFDRTVISEYSDHSTQEAIAEAFGPPPAPLHQFTFYQSFNGTVCYRQIPGYTLTRATPRITRITG